MPGRAKKISTGCARTRRISIASSRTSAMPTRNWRFRDRGLSSSCRRTNAELNGIKNYWFTHGTVCGLKNTLIARTGYTGEDGFEIYVPSDVATSEKVWNQVMEAGREFAVVPCGLGSRNT